MSHNKTQKNENESDVYLDQAILTFAKHPMWFGDNTMLKLPEETHHRNNNHNHNNNDNAKNISRAVSLDKVYDIYKTWCTRFSTSGQHTKMSLRNCFLWLAELPAKSTTEARCHHEISEIYSWMEPQVVLSLIAFVLDCLICLTWCYIPHTTRATPLSSKS